jgi:hypothetical protein
LLQAVVVGGIAGLLLAAAPAPASTFIPSSDSLPGSSFQGADGDQDDAAQLFDWRTLSAGGSVRHNRDPNDADSAFKGGSKEDAPGDWDGDEARGALKLIAKLAEDTRK